MKVFDREPSDWKVLQDMVGQLFEEMGCEVEVGKQVLNVRATKEITVHVSDPAIAPGGVCLCECKYWIRRYETNFPSVLPAVNERGEFEGVITISSYRQLYDLIESNLPEALYHLQVLHGEIRPNRAQGEYDPLAPSASEGPFVRH
jgi:hypothetical protein